MIEDQFYSTDCYRCEHLYFENPTFKKIPVSFLITMENSQRRDSYLKELKHFRPTSHVVIVHNKGFKKCYKQNVATSYQDLWHANLHIFKLTESWKHPILLMEDDVNFTTHFQNYAPEIEHFVLQENVEVYNLGCVPVISNPVSTGNHCRVFCFGSTHAMIYSYEVRKRLLQENAISFNTEDLHDSYIGKMCTCFTHVYPCAVQNIPKTNNRDNWPLFSKIYLNLFAFTEPDIDGYVFYYLQHALLYFGGIIPFLLMLILVLIVFTKTYRRMGHKTLYV